MKYINLETENDLSIEHTILTLKTLAISKIVHLETGQLYDKT